MKQLFLAAAIAVPLALPASASSLLVGTLFGEIAEVDTTTGVVSNAFNPGVGSWFDIAVNNVGTAFGTVNILGFDILYEIDVAAQTATSVGTMGAFINSLAFGPTNTLYGAGDGSFYSIDTTTATTTLIGNVGGAFDSSGDLAFAGGSKMFATSVGSVAGGDTLWEIDIATGAGTEIGSTGVAGLFGLGIIDGTLYGTSAANDLYTVDTSTGAASFVTSYAVTGDTGGAAVPPSTVAPIPVPAALPLMLAGIGALGFAARRRHAQA
jgi:hypothetical protein